MRATVIGNEELIRNLIEKGANVNATNNAGDSVLIAAALNCKYPNKGEWRKNYYSLQSIWIDVLSHTDHIGIFKMLIENGADINYKDANDKTPLIILASQGNQHHWRKIMIIIQFYTLSCCYYCITN